MFVWWDDRDAESDDDCLTGGRLSFCLSYAIASAGRLAFCSTPSSAVCESSLGDTDMGRTIFFSSCVKGSYLSAYTEIAPDGSPVHPTSGGDMSIAAQPWLKCLRAMLRPPTSDIASLSRLWMNM